MTLSFSNPSAIPPLIFLSIITFGAFEVAGTKVIRVEKAAVPLPNSRAFQHRCGDEFWYRSADQIKPGNIQHTPCGTRTGLG